MRPILSRSQERAQYSHEVRVQRLEEDMDILEGEVLRLRKLFWTTAGTLGALLGSTIATLLLNLLSRQG